MADVLSEELSDGRRIVAKNGAFISYAPYATPFAGAQRIVPRKASPSFAAMSNGDTAEFAQTLRDSVARLRGWKPDVDYNILLYTAPFAQDTAEWFCWYADIVPRTNVLAGIEIGLSIYCSTTSPEEAAEKLRSVAIH
jgi:UDPglucose--hexose-1-phosphate uridylyltransferase